MSGDCDSGLGLFSALAHGHAGRGPHELTGQRQVAVLPCRTRRLGRPRRQQLAPSLIAQTQAGGLEEIIVTARKREESLLSIPQEIQAIGQEQIEQANLKTVDDISRFVPSLSYNATTPGRGTIYFRGVADDSSSFIADASAAIYLDEQPLTQSSLQPEIRLVDIERIEALPGPQGTLYGASSQAGTLRYITNKPDPARVRVERQSRRHLRRRRRGRLRPERGAEPAA